MRDGYEACMKRKVFIPQTLWLCLASIDGGKHETHMDGYRVDRDLGGLRVEDDKHGSNGKPAEL
jgi:hypothetical protein